MATRSKKTVWLIAAVVMVVLLQLAVIAFIATNVFSQTAQRPQPQPRDPQKYPPPTARPIKRQPVRQVSVPQPRPKPTGPRAAPPEFSKTGGIYTNALTVTLQAKSSNAVIRYTLDGTEPSEQSPTYSAPIPVRETVVLRASCFERGLAPSTAVTHTYTMLGEDLLNFSSNLPLVVIDTFNQSIGYYQEYLPASFRFIDLTGNRSSLLGMADFDGRADLKRRGFSSLRFPKMSFTLKTRDDDGEKVKAPLFGLPSDSDWVLYAPYVDKTLMRDVLGYEISNQMGRYAPRTRFVEVFVHRGAGKLKYSDYAGVYVLVEKIKRGKERVNIAKLDPE